MLLEMKVPSPGESISEVEIATWLVEDGEYVEKDQEIAEVDSDKATLALPAEVSGAIKIVVEEGETVAVGDIVCVIDTSVKGVAKVKPAEAEESAPVSHAPKSNTSLDAKATPLAKEYIKQNDVSPSAVKGTGEGGKILKEDVIEVIVPAFEGEMGLLKDHISIISFLRPGIMTVRSKVGEEKFYVEDGIIEFKDNVLSVHTSSISNLKEIDKSKIQDFIKNAEEVSNDPKISDQVKYLADQKIEVLKTIN